VKLESAIVAHLSRFNGQ